MTLLDKRPAGVFASVFYVLSCVLFSVSYGVRSCAIVLSFVMLLLAAVFGKRLISRRGLSAVLAGAFAASVFASAVVDIKIPREASFSEGSARISGTVTEVQYRSSYSGIYTVDSDIVKFSLKCENGELSVGDIVSCDAEFSDMDEEYLEYTRADGVFVSAEADGAVELVGDDDSFILSVTGFRDSLSAKLKSSMSESSGGFAASLLLGDRSGLPGFVERDFRILGISHILALSGTHLTVLFFGLSRLIPERKRVLRVLTVCPVVLLYMLLVGFSASVTRAGIMFIIATVGDVIGKRNDSFTSLSLSVLFICICNPYAPYDIGLQLSYLAVIGLVLSSRISEKLKHGKGILFQRIIDITVPAVTVPSVLLPLMWLRFGSVSLVSPVANIIFVPIASLFIPLVAIILVISPITNLFASLSYIADVLISWFLGITGYTARLVGTSLPLAGNVTTLIIIAFALCVGSAVLIRSARRVLVPFSSVLVCLALAVSQWYFAGYNTGVTACFSSNKSDEAVSVISDGYNILFDIGRYPSATKRAARLGALYGTEKIDAMFITKPYKSHKTTIREIAENYYLKSVWLPAASNEEDRATTEALAADAMSMGIDVFTYIPGERLYFGECELEAPVREEKPGDVGFAIRCGDEIVCYSGADFNDASAVNIVGAAGLKKKGVLNSESVSVLSPDTAAVFESVPENAVVGKRCVIRACEGETTVSVKD